MKVAALQFDIVWENKKANYAYIERMLNEADLEPGTFLLLPELGDTGFSFNLDVIVDDLSLEWACRIARHYRIWVQHGFADRVDDDGERPPGRNCAAIVNPEGECVGIYRKVFPFSFSREVEYFSGGDRLVIRQCDSSGRDRAEGPAGAVLCPLICYDLRFPELWRLGAMAGAEVFTIGASWPSPRQSHWRTLCIARAIENQAYLVAVNRVGDDPHLSYVGGSIIVDPMGNVLAEADDQPQLLEADLDLESLRSWRDTFPALKDVRPELLGSMTIDR